MVAAPESIAQAPVVAPPAAAVKLVNGGGKAAVHEVGGDANGVEGTGAQGNGLTVAASPSRPSSADFLAAKAASARSHNSNFDPTPSASANIPPPEIARNIPCRFFPIGTCKYGDKCAFSHTIAGTAAGAPPSAVPVVQAPAQVQAQEYSHEAYYAQQAYQPHFAPQQGYYPFQPQFQPQYYPQAPQHYYQHAPPPQAMHPEQVMSPSASPALALAHTTEPASASAPPAPTSPDQTLPSATLPTSLSSPSVSQGAPLAAEYPAEVLFQTGASPAAALPKAPLAGVARPPAGPRRTGPPMSMGPFRRPHPHGSKFGGAPRPPCSFFEANRCRNGDACGFAHMLPDGTDARVLQQGLIGNDGRTANPEEKGGIPPAWVANPLTRGNFPRGAQGGGPGPRASMNGGYSVREPTKPRNFPATGAESEPAVEGHPVVAHGKPAGQFAHLARQPFPARAPGVAAPAIVAAIQGLTRRMPPVANGNGPQQATAPQQAAAAPRQRLPSADEFPALSTPTSPTIAEPVKTLSTPVSPVVAPVQQSTPVPAAPWSPEHGRDGAPASEPVVAASTDSLVRPSPSEHSDSDFVIITHQDASPIPIVAAPVVAAPVVVPAPIVPAAPMSYGAAAARGAAIPAPVVPERVRKVVAPVKVDEEAKEAPAAAPKKSKKPKGERRAPAAQAPAQAPAPSTPAAVAPVAIAA